MILQRTRRPRLATALVLVLVLAGTSCSSGSDKSPGSAGSREPKAAEEGVMRVGLERPDSLDPAQSGSPEALLVAEQLFDGLTSYDPATLSVQPAIAARWQASADQKTWDFGLRPDARFSNGRAITADDVRFTFDRITRKGSASPASGQLDQVKGYRAFHFDGKADTLAGVTAPAPDVVRIALDQPLSTLPAILGHPSFGIVPKEAVEAPSPAFAVEPMGSGPFMIGARTDEMLRLVPSAGSRATLKAVEFEWQRDNASSYAAFTAGGLDWTRVPADRAEEVAERSGRAGFGPYVGELFYGFNLKNPKYADIRFREAIVRAIDRDAIVRVVYGGGAGTATGVVADGVPGHQADACSRCGYDPDRARALVGEAFAGKPLPEVQIDFDDDPTQRSVAEAIRANLSAVGIPAALRPHPYGDYLKFATAGNQELFRLGWIGFHPSPDAFLTPLFQTGLPDNLTGFSSPDVDRVLKAARAEGDEARRNDLYRQAEKAILDQLPVVPMVQLQFHTAVSSRVEGLTTSAFGTFDASTVRVK